MLPDTAERAIRGLSISQGNIARILSSYHESMQSFTSVAPASPDLARKPLPVIIALSVLIASALVWLIYFKGKVAATGWVSVLPAGNAVFTLLSAICLIVG